MIKSYIYMRVIIHANRSVPNIIVRNLIISIYYAVGELLYYRVKKKLFGD